MTSGNSHLQKCINEVAVSNVNGRCNQLFTVHYLTNRKHLLVPIELQKYNRSLGECKMLWEHDLAAGEYFHSFCKFSQAVTSVSLTQ